MAVRKNLLVTGRPGTGKTTVIRRVLQRLDLPAGGFFTQELTERGRRVGFQIVTLDGATATLAHVRQAGPHRVGRYRVNVEGIEQAAVPALQRALQSAPLIVVDEIAKMELASPLFAEIALACLDSATPVLGVLQMSRLPFIERIRRRPDVELIHLTPSNRDGLVAEIAGRVRGLLSTGRDP